MVTKHQYRPNYRLSQSGMSLIETMIALAILLIATVGLLSMGMIATATTENQGHLVARTAEYAQDKMEQLVSLAFCDSTTDTTAYPLASSTGGTGLMAKSTNCSGGPALGASYGSSDPTAPVATPGTGFVDYLDNSGQPSSSTGNWFYVRVWQIDAVSDPATGNYNLKRITVTAKVRSQVGAPQGSLPQSTLVSMKSYPF
jgi:prepilin-type N-terminal cleavage/methylation domain-containing protein